MSPALRLSLAANVVLAGLLGWAVLRFAPEPESPSARGTEAPSPTPHSTPTSSATLPLASPVAAFRLDPATVQRLQREGFSRDALVTAFLTEFQRDWDERFAALPKKYAPRPVPERAYLELARERDLAQVRALQGALGEAGYLAWDQDRLLRQLNPNNLPLTNEESLRLYRLQKELEEQNNELQRALEDGVADRADTNLLQNEAQEKYEKELEALLGSQRLAQMRGYSDPLADVQRSYAALSPTVEQARAVQKIEEDTATLQERLSKTLQDAGTRALSVEQELQALQEAREQRLREIFGSEAYEEKKRNDDPTFQTLQRYAANWGLQDAEVGQVYEALSALHDQADLLRSAASLRQSSGQAVNWREVDTVLAQARQQTEASLLPVLGESRLRRLRDNGLLDRR